MDPTKRPFNNRNHGMLQRQAMPRISQEIIDKARGVFPERDLTGNESSLEIGILEGHKQVIKWLQRQVQSESTISGNPDDLRK